MKHAGELSLAWVAGALLVATAGFAGAVLADGSADPPGKKVVPFPKSKTERLAPAVVDDATGSPVGVSAPPKPQSRSGIPPLSPPSNDDACTAIILPDGPYPFVTAAEDLSEATPQGIDEGILTVPIDATVWFSLTPSETNVYTFSTCTDGGAAGTTMYDTVIGLFPATGGSCPPGPQLGVNDTGADCATTAASIGNPPYIDQAILSAVLTAGQTYLIVVGHYSFSDGAVVAPPFQNVSLFVTHDMPPANDTCSAPQPLALDRVTLGTTVGAHNDYRSPSTAACYSGVGQTPTTAPGRDAVFSFTAPAAGSYSFRYVQDDSAAALRGQNPALYLSDTCPAPAPAGPAVNCIKGANRITVNGPANGNRSEEIDCVPMSAGQTYYLFFDDDLPDNAGGPLGVEVTECHRESEPNDTPATANAPACFTTGRIQPGDSYVCRAGTTNAGAPCSPAVEATSHSCSTTSTAADCVFSASGDTDFYALGNVPVGGKVFAAVDAIAANDGDFEMRITTSTDTLQYDNDDGTSQISANAPVIGGTPGTGQDEFVRVSHRGATSEPYHLYTRVETGPPQLEVDTPSNFSFYYANWVTGGGFVRGVTSSAADGDCFKFLAHQGDNITMFSDNNPDRTPSNSNDVWPIMYDLTFDPPAATRLMGQVLRNNLTPSPGTLTGTTPSITSEFWDYRARYTGLYLVCWYPNVPAGSPSLFPLAWAGDVSLNCNPIPPPSSHTADVSVTKSGPADGALTGSVQQYVIAVKNNSADSALDVNIRDVLPNEVTLLGLFVDDGFGGNDIGCLSVPDGSSPGGELNCTNFTMAPGTTTTYTLVVQVVNCIGAGVSVDNTATIVGTASIDPNPANNSASWSFTTAEDGTCTDFDACTLNDHCEAGVCVTTPLDCDDNNVCTSDSCNPLTGCINEPAAENCGDGNPCTNDMCDPEFGCVFPPAAAGTPCDDFNACTNNDACDGQGSCSGTLVCADDNPCTLDTVDDFTSCTCFHFPESAGTPCSDGNACTDGDACDAAATCIPGAPTECDDGNPCTDDACDPQTGCVHTNNTAPCSDGNACTAGDVCGSGTCHAGAPISCDDGNPCTDDACDPQTGCVHTNNTAPCSDGNACTAGDVCGGGTCHAGAPISCDDGNCCTIDSCDPATGCTHAPNPAAPVFTTQPSLGACPVLWPPEHGYADFTVAQTGAAAQSACGVVSIAWASCASSQVENAFGTGDGNSTRDCVFTSDTLSTRAERDGACSPIGRTYTARLIAVDACGHTTLSDPVEIDVWHDRGHAPGSPNVFHAADGSTTNDTRNGTNGSYPAGGACGTGGACANGTGADASDADPEAEIRQQAAVSVDTLRVDKTPAGLRLSWTAPTSLVPITRYHVWRLDPLTLFWTNVAETDATALSYAGPVDGSSWQYKVTAVVK